MIYSRIDNVNDADDAGVRTNNVNTINEGKARSFSEPHLRFGELIEATTETDLTQWLGSGRRGTHPGPSERGIVATITVPSRVNVL